MHKPGGWAPHASVAFDGPANHRGVYADGKFTHIHIRACRWDLGFVLGLWPGFYWPLAGFLALWQGSCLLTPPLCMFVLLKMTLGLFFLMILIANGRAAWEQPRDLTWLDKVDVDWQIWECWFWMRFDIIQLILQFHSGMGWNRGFAPFHCSARTPWRWDESNRHFPGTSHGLWKGQETNFNLPAMGASCYRAVHGGYHCQLLVLQANSFKPETCQFHNGWRHMATILSKPRLCFHGHLPGHWSRLARVDHSGQRLCSDLRRRGGREILCA